MNHKIAIRLGLFLVLVMAVYAFLSLRRTADYTNESLPVRGEALLVDIRQDSLIRAINRVYVSRGKTDITLDSVRNDMFEIKFPSHYGILDLASINENRKVKDENEDILKAERMIEVADEGDYHILRLFKQDGYVSCPAYILVELLKE